MNIDGELLSFESDVSPNLSSMKTARIQLSNQIKKLNAICTNGFSLLPLAFKSNASTSIQSEISSLATSNKELQNLCDTDLNAVLTRMDILLQGITTLKAKLRAAQEALEYYQRLCALSDEEKEEQEVNIGAAETDYENKKRDFEDYQAQLKQELGGLRSMTSAYSAVPLDLSSSSSSTNVTVISSELRQLNFRYNGVNYQYLLYVPTVAEGDVKLPLITYLHGTGEIGRVGALQASSIGQMLQNNNYPAYVLIPVNQRVPNESKEPSWRFARGLNYVDALTEQIIRDYPIDEQRMAITGFSDGAVGVYSAVSRHPNRYSVAVPVSGYANNNDVVQNITQGNTKFSIFHSTSDRNIDESKDRATYQSLASLGVDVNYTQLQGISHGDTDDVVYQDNDYLTQILKQLDENKENTTELG